MRPGSFVFLIFLSLCLFVFSAHAHTEELPPELNAQYKNKIFLLRGFYSRDHLQYDSTGKIDRAETGDWTTSGFVEVERLSISGSRLTIEARRLLLSSPYHDGFSLNGGKKRGKNTSPLKIDADLNPDEPPEKSVKTALSQIFFTAQDSFADSVPEYWKFCIVNGLRGKNENCHFSRELRRVPGMDLSQNAQAEIMTDPKNMPFYHLGSSGVTPPQFIAHPKPAFSEAARKVRYQGTDTIWLVVDTSGNPTNIRITDPLGLGLDEEAVRAVKTWKLQPATKDGQFVAAEISVEVEFHLF